MTHFVVVAAVRIQPWLARTPRLALIRGASRALHEVTTKGTVEKVLTRAGLSQPNTTVAVDAGDVDGVIVVQTTNAQLDTVRRVLRQHVRQELPGLEWTVWDGQVPTVFDALKASKDRSELVLAEVMTVPFAQRCEGCGMETAAKQVTADQSLWFGPDCLARWAGGQSGGRPGHTYRDRLSIPGADPPATMNDLASAPGKADQRADRYGGKRNHLAVVCADGNSIGDLFNGIPEQQRATAVSALDAATQQALTAAAHAVTDQKIVVEPHFVGGDDILVSVPAPLAWSFALHLARSFEQILSEYLHTVTPGEVSASLGIGLCFSHEAYPFAHAREVSFAAMKEAKRATRGRAAAVGWADLTAEDQVVPGRHRTVAQLQRLRAGAATGADLVVSATNSARAQIAAEIDQGSGRFSAPERAVDRLTNQARRSNDHPFEDWLNSVPAQEAIDELRTSISLARWWPGPRATGTTSSPTATPGSVPA